MSKFTGLILIVALCAPAYASFWSSCGGAVPAPIDITSPVCAGTVCTLTAGTTANFNARLRFAAAHSALTMRVLLFVQGVAVEIPLPDNRACPMLTPGCPTSAGSEHSLALAVPISAEPAVRGPARARGEFRELL